MKLVIFSAVISLLVCGCSTNQSTSAPTVGPLPIMVMGTGEGRPRPKTVFLPTDYGFFINWPEGGSGEFYLYDRPSHKIAFTTEFPAFLAGLKKFPDKAIVTWVETCAVHQSRGMPLKQGRQLHALMQVKKFRFYMSPQQHFIVCACQSRKYELLKDANWPQAGGGK